MKRWLTYLQERSPLAPLTFIAAGTTLSGQLMLGEYSWLYTLIGIIGTLGVLIQLRLGDELKDFEKDRIVHPERPLPRGLLKPAEVERAMKWVMIALLVLAALSTLVGHWLGGLGLAVSTLFGWLMYREFYFGKRLNQMPMAYALSHQLIVFPLYGWPTGLIYDRIGQALPVYLLYLIFNFGASMTFEIARKLDPKAHPLQQTYLHHYGAWRTTSLLVLFISLSMIASSTSPYPIPAILIWFQIPLLLSIFLIPTRPQKFKIIEGLAVLSATAHLWVFGLLHLWFKAFGVAQ